MGLFVLFLLAFPLFFLFLKLIASPTHSPRPAIDLPYQKKRWFFSHAERVFFHVLGQAVRQIDRELVIFSKVRLADLVIMTQGTRGTAYWRARGRISQKHADFILLRPAPSGEAGALEPVLVVELDDASHEREDRRRRDALVDAIYQRAGLPILHIPARQGYDVRQLAAQIRKTLGIPLYED
jgi:hypothetical protein